VIWHKAQIMDIDKRTKFQSECVKLRGPFILVLKL
jgi:hypothetical protein